jgi:hypothetical protein
MFVCPKITSGKFDGGILYLQSESPSEKDIIFENVLYFHIIQKFINIEWKNSGPSGPWGRFVSEDFIGIEYNGNYITNWNSEHVNA